MPDLIELNLLPIEDRIIKKDYSYLLDARIIIPLITLILLLIALSVSSAYYDKELSAKQLILDALMQQVKEKESIKNQIKVKEKLLQEIDSKYTALNSINVNKQLWLDILEGISASLPENTWVEQIAQEKQTPFINISGNTHIFSEVGHYITRLKKKLVFLEVSLISINYIEDSKSRFFKFEIKIEIDNGLLTSQVNSSDGKKIFAASQPTKGIGAKP